MDTTAGHVESTPPIEVGSGGKVGFGSTNPQQARDNRIPENEQYRTRAPKGIFIYDNHADMDRDRLRWTVERIVERERNG